MSALDSISPQELQKLSFLYAGKQLLRQEIHLDDLNFQEMINLDYFQKVPPIVKKTFSNQCQRCGNHDASLFGIIPCSLCQSKHLYCRKCIEMGRVMKCSPLYRWNGPSPEWPNHTHPCTWQGDLTAVQQKAANRMVQAITNQEDLLIWAVCGAGKTEMLFPGITEALRQGLRICIATPRADVVRELLPRIQEAFQSVSVEALYGGSEHKEGSAQLILATTHQLLRFANSFDVLIIDEVDAFPFHHDASLQFAAQRAKKKSSSTIYLTATPRRKQRIQLKRKQLPHIFVPIRYHGHPLPVPTFQQLNSMKKLVTNNELPQKLTQWLNQRKKLKRQLLIFVPTIQLAEQLKDPLHAESVHAEDPEREKKVQLFRQRKIYTLVTTTILERGVTFPSVDVAVLDSSHEVFDEAALVQIAGRAGRSANDPTGEVMFFHDGKTEAMVRAVRTIHMMNRKGESL